MNVLADHEHYRIEVDAHGFFVFTFGQNLEQALEAFQNFHEEIYSNPNETQAVLMLIRLQKDQMLPFAHMTQDTKHWIAQGNPVLPTRHAFLTQSDMPKQLIQGLFKTLPSEADIKAGFFSVEEFDDAMAWLLVEREKLNQVASTTPQYKMG